jgi:hypothetical protein
MRQFDLPKPIGDSRVKTFLMNTLCDYIRAEGQVICSPI